jgi:cell division protein FtsQ
LIVGKDGLSLALGAAPFRRKLEEAGRVIAETDRRGSRASAIMLDDDARPERVVVRTR